MTWCDSMKKKYQNFRQQRIERYLKQLDLQSNSDLEQIVQEYSNMYVAIEAQLVVDRQFYEVTGREEFAEAQATQILELLGLETVILETINYMEIR